MVTQTPNSKGNKESTIRFGIILIMFSFPLYDDGQIGGFFDIKKINAVLEYSKHIFFFNLTWMTNVYQMQTGNTNTNLTSLKQKWHDKKIMKASRAKHCMLGITRFQKSVRVGSAWNQTHLIFYVHHSKLECWSKTLTFHDAKFEFPQFHNATSKALQHGSHVKHCQFETVIHAGKVLNLNVALQNCSVGLMWTETLLLHHGWSQNESSVVRIQMTRKNKWRTFQNGALMCSKDASASTKGHSLFTFQISSLPKFQVTLYNFRGTFPRKILTRKSL